MEYRKYGAQSLTRLRERKKMDGFHIFRGEEKGVGDGEHLDYGA